MFPSPGLDQRLLVAQVQTIQEPFCIWRHQAAAQSTDSLALLAVLWGSQHEQRGILVLISGSSDTRRQVREEVKVQYLVLFHLYSLSVLRNLFQVRKANI